MLFLSDKTTGVDDFVDNWDRGGEGGSFVVGEIDRYQVGVSSITDRTW